MALKDVAGEPAGQPSLREVFRGRRGLLTVGLLMLEALAAVEALVVATIMPAVERDLGSLQLYGWVFSAYLLAAFATIPIAGRAVDRFGARAPLGLMLGLYSLGLVISAAAPTMLVIVGGRFVQGLGAGGLYSVSLGTVAKTYPDRLRPRVLALLATMWILPGLFGPPLGAFLTATVGWRWAFLAPLPAVVAAAALVLPAIGDIQVDPGDIVEIPIRDPIQLMVGAAAFLGGLTDPSIWSVPLLVAGVAIGVPPLRRIVPAGTLRARPGLPAAAAAACLLSVAFMSADGFVPLQLTRIHGLSVGIAGLAITLATFSWAFGSWWQSRKATTWPPSRLVAAGAILLSVGLTAVGAGLIPSAPVQLVYAGWLVAAMGIGIAFPTIPVAVMRSAAAGSEAGELSSTLLMDVLGAGIGAGLGGSSVAIARAAGLSLRVGLTGAAIVAVLAALALLGISRRLPTGTAA